MEFKHAIKDKVLVGHVVKSYVVNSKDDCELKCYMEEDCMSINLGLDEGGRYLCELSNSDHELHPEDLQRRHGFTYGPTKVRCH